MRGGKRRVACALAAGALIAASGLTGCGFLGIYGCGDRDWDLADRLDELAVLDLHPPGSTVREQYSGCDDDDVYAFAAREYSPVAGTDVVAFYRGALPGQGWVPEISEEPARSPVCFAREVEGAKAYLFVWFESEHGEKSDDFTLQVNASYKKGAFC